METNLIKKRMQRLIVAILTMSLVLTGFMFMPAASQIANPDSDYGVAYAAASKVKVTWNANGGKIGKATTKPFSYNKNAKVKKLQAATRTGYTLKGWYTAKKGGKKITKNTKVTKKTTFYAQWSVKKYTLTYNANGGTVTPKSKKVEYKKGYGTLPTPTLEGHSFEGWFTAKTGGTKVSTTTKMVSKNVTVFAQWTKNRTLTEEEKKLVGSWCHLYRYNMSGPLMGSSCRAYTFVYNFYDDGTFLRYNSTFSGTIVGGQPSFVSGFETYLTGNFSLSGNTLMFTSVKVNSTALSANNGTKWRAVGTREGGLAALKNVPTGTYSSSSLSSENISHINTWLITIGDDDNGDKSNYFQKNWEDGYDSY